MLIQQKTGNISSFAISNRTIDLLPLYWYETNKRILHKRSLSGTDITLKFLNQPPEFSQGDIVFESRDCLIVIDILPCDAIVVRPVSMQQMASLCYEIGNRHLPLFIDGEEILVPADVPLFLWLAANGFEPARESRKLLNPLKTTTIAHINIGTGAGLFSKIIEPTKNIAND